MSSRCGTITVLPTFDPDAVGVEGCEIPAEVGEGEIIPVSLTFGNGNNELDAIVEYTLVVNGDETLTDSTEVPAGESVDVDVEVDPAGVGNYEIGVQITATEA